MSITLGVFGIAGTPDGIPEGIAGIPAAAGTMP
jgi:hypothetical protein